MANTVNSPAKRRYENTPFGIARHPWLNKPDTKFDENGEYKVDLEVSGPEAIKLKEKVVEAADRYFAEATAEMTPGERKKWSVYYPFEELEDAEGNPTGTIKFKLRQNAVIRLKDGSEKRIQMLLQDGNGEDTTKAIFNGATLRCRFSLRDIKMTSGKQFGVRMDMAGAQVTKFGGNSGGGAPGFGKAEGYEDEGPAEGESFEKTSDGDY